MKTIDYNKFNKIVVVGDIHGCWDPLKKLIDKHPVTEDVKYIFLGDYEDRGNQHKELFEHLLEFSKDSSHFLFLRGNHSIHTLNFSQGKPVDSKQFRDYTKSELSCFDKKVLEKFCKRQADFTYFSFGDCDFLCCHGGVDKIPNEFTNSSELVKGIGTYDDSEKVKKTFKKNVENFDRKTYQIHGHRNIFDVKIDDGLISQTFNLEGGIEKGGFLRAIVLTKDENWKVKFDFEEISNKNSEALEDQKLISLLDANDLIIKKTLKNDITSYKFSKRCFFNGIWDQITTKARGLFVRDGKVVARSYDKFFNMGEMRSFENDLEKLTFPVNIYEKENGYLGIVTYDKEIQDLHFFSKSTDEGPFAEFFKNFVKNKGNLYENLLKYLRKNDVSMVFEVCTKKDPHIVEYENDQIFLLDIFKNKMTESKLPYLEMVAIAQKVGCTFKRFRFRAEDKEEFLKFLDRAMSSHQIEGFVIEDSVGFKLKIKTFWYKFWKDVRNRKENAFVKQPSFIQTSDEIDFLNAKDKINSDEFKSTNLLGEEVFNVIKFRKFATAPKKKS